MITKTFYAIYNTQRKQFKGRGKFTGARWTDEPTQTYDTEGRATAALKLHFQALTRWRHPLVNEEFVVKPITVSWEDWCYLVPRIVV